MNIHCQHSKCTNEATTAGYIYGHERGSEQDKLYRMYACDKHKKSPGFFEDEGQEG